MRPRTERDGVSIYDDIKPLGLEGVSTYPLAERPSKVAVEDFARPFGEESSLREFLASLPDILAVKSLRALAAQMRPGGGPRQAIIWGGGGHVVKVGLAPLIIDLMKRGFVSGVAANGSVLVHDAEIALVGSTSEDVDATLGAGAFGAAEETGRLLNEAAREGARDQMGLGEALGRALSKLNPKHADLSLLCALTARACPSRPTSPSAQTSRTSTRRPTALHWARRRTRTSGCWPS